jgi:hypothetical protein
LPLLRRKAALGLVDRISSDPVFETGIRALLAGDLSG